jgi:hypothetical protein
MRCPPAVSLCVFVELFCVPEEVPSTSLPPFPPLRVACFLTSAKTGMLLLLAVSSVGFTFCSQICENLIGGALFFGAVRAVFANQRCNRWCFVDAGIGLSDFC